MLNPPVKFSQLLVAQWGSSTMIAALWYFFTKLRTPDLLVAAYATLASGGLAFTFFTWVTWRSRFGSLHGLLAPPILAVLLFYPMSQSLLPAMGLEKSQVLILDLLALALHVLVLSLTAAWHWHRIPPVEAGKNTLNWPGMQILVKRRMLKSTASIGNFDWVSPGLTAVIGTFAYAIFKNVFDAPSRPAGAAALMTAVSLWLYISQFGSIWGQAFRLKKLEKNLYGALFVHEQYPLLQAERNKRFMGRFFKCFGPDR